MKEIFRNFQFQKQILWLDGALPALLLAWDWRTENLGANPPEAFIRKTGIIAISHSLLPSPQLLTFVFAALILALLLYRFFKYFKTRAT